MKSKTIILSLSLTNKQEKSSGVDTPNKMAPISLHGWTT